MKAGRALLLFALAFPLSGVNAGEQKASLSAPFAVAPDAGEAQPQYFPQLAWSAGARVWLAVWQQGDPTGDETGGGGRAQDIFAARISADGKPLDAKPLVVCSAKDFQGQPVVASDGKDFLVIWHDLRSGKDWDLYAARVTGDGKVLDPDGTLLVGGDAASHNQCFPAVCFAPSTGSGQGGGGYYVAWLDARHWPEYRVYGGRVSGDGKMLDAGGVELIRAITDQQLEAWRKASFSPGKHGKDGWHIHAAQMCAPTVATNGKVHVVTAYRSMFGTGGENDDEQHFLRRVDAASGRPLDAALALPLGAAAGSAQGLLPKSAGIMRTRFQMVPTGGGFLAGTYFYKTGFGVPGDAIWAAAFLDAEGKPACEGKSLPRLRLIAGDKGQSVVGYRGYSQRPHTIALAWDGKRALYVVERYIQRTHKDRGLEGNVDLLGILVNAEGRRISDFASGATVEPDKIKVNGPTYDFTEGPRLEPFLLAGGPETQAVPAACAGPEGSFLVLWQEESPDKDSRIMARMVGVK